MGGGAHVQGGGRGASTQGSTHSTQGHSGTQTQRRLVRRLRPDSTATEGVCMESSQGVDAPLQSC